MPKGNNGRGAKMRLAKRVVVVLSAFCIILFVSTRFAMLSSGGGSSGRRYRGRTSSSWFSGVIGGRRPPRGGDDNLAAVPRSAAGSERDLEDIVRGKIHLVDVTIATTTGDRDDSDEEQQYHHLAGVTGEFCRVDWRRHNRDPAATPMFRDAVAQSADCQKRPRVRFNFKTVLRACRNRDKEREENGSHNVGGHNDNGKVLNFTAAVFHESRCGSTLAANVLTAADPAKHRVYSESDPPMAALQMCGEEYRSCSVDRAAAVLRDVVYLMSRTDGASEERVFLKVQSIGSLYLPVFLTAFPGTPWLYVFRDPVQVMMSHLSRGGRGAAVCLRKLKQKNASVSRMAQLGSKLRRRRRQEHDRRQQKQDEQMIAADSGNPRDWKIHDFCAAHLATLTEAAVAAMTGGGGGGGANVDKKKNTGIAVNYADLPDRLYEEILPLLGVPAPSDDNAAALDRIAAVARQYSKGRGTRKGVFAGDSDAKEEAASPSIRRAAETFMRPSYAALQRVAADQRRERAARSGAAAEAAAADASAGVSH